jgi:hypothetical protein
VTARSAVHVYAVSKDGTKRQWLAPGDEVPSWARLDERNLQGGAGGGEASDSAQRPPGANVSEPSRSGRGSSIDAWRSFAERKGVSVDSDMSRDDIIAACEQAGAVSSEG